LIGIERAIQISSSVTHDISLLTVTELYQYRRQNDDHLINRYWTLSVPTEWWSLS